MKLRLINSSKNLNLRRILQLQKTKLMLLGYFDKVKTFLLDMEHEINSENQAEGIFIISNENKGIKNAIIDCEGEILVIEQHIMSIDKDDAQMYKKLLQMNRTLIHGAFVLNETGTMILFRDTLQLSNLDFNELDGSLNALSIGLAENGEQFLDWAS